MHGSATLHADPKSIMLADALKAATAQRHRYAEARPLQKLLVQGGLPLPTLLDYLGQLMLVHERLEERLDAATGSHDAVRRLWSEPFSVRGRHGQRLRADLAHAGVDADAIDPTDATQRTLDLLDGDAVTLVGFLYVLEGSMNGNRFITRALARAYAGQSFACSYFDPYGDAQRELWARFRSGIDRCELDSVERQRMLDAAGQAFDAIAEISDAVIERARPA